MSHQASGAHVYRLEPLTRAGFPLLASWLAQPHVSRWWHHEYSAEALERDFGEGIDGSDPSENLLVLRDGEPIGLVQRCLLADYPDYLAEIAAVTTVPSGAMTIDYFVGEQSRTGQGIGTEMVRAVVQDTWRAFPDAAALVVPVVAANRPSWRVLERAGFRRTGEGDIRPDNPIDEPRHFVYQVNRPTA